LVDRVPPPSFTTNTKRPYKRTKAMKITTEPLKAYSLIRLSPNYKGKLAQISFSGEMTSETKEVIKEINK
jgi:hypothetical protein